VGVCFPREGKKAGGMRSDEQLAHKDREGYIFGSSGSKKELFVQKRAPQSKNIFFTRFVFFVSKFSRDTKKIIPHTN
jgi:hypothetical protein